MPRALLATLFLLAAALGASADSSAPPEPGYDEAADENHDGRVTRREARRYRRALRRAQRRARGLPEEAEPTEEEELVEEQLPEKRRQRALRRASAVAAGMKADTLDEPGELPAGSSSGAPSGPGTALAASGSAAAGPAVTAGAASGGAAAALAPIASGGAALDLPSGDPARPSAPADFVLAARGGYAPALARAGLTLAADGRSIVRADGSPATVADYRRLDGEIRAMPAALAQRPDFFRHVSPERYSDLKRGYVERGPELAGTVFKHVETTEQQRDFVHSASCARLSGECNASVERQAYKKGDFVDPKDLDRMWTALEAELESPKGVEDKSSAAAGPADPSALAPEGRAQAPPPSDSAAPQTSERHGAGGPHGAKPEGLAPTAAVMKSVRRAWNGTVAAFGGTPASEADSRGDLALGAGAGAVFAAILWLCLRRRGPDDDGGRSTDA